MSFEEAWQKLRGLVLENLRKHSFPTSDDQRHILKDSRPSTAACPACWTMGRKGLKRSTARKKYFILGRLKQPRQNKNLMPNEPTMEGPLSVVFLESQLTSVSTVSRGHPSLVSLAFTFLSASDSKPPTTNSWNMYAPAKANKQDLFPSNLLCVQSVR